MNSFLHMILVLRWHENLYHQPTCSPSVSSLSSFHCILSCKTDLQVLNFCFSLAIILSSCIPCPQTLVNSLNPSSAPFWYADISLVLYSLCLRYFTKISFLTTFLRIGGTVCSIFGVFPYHPTVPYKMLTNSKCGYPEIEDRTSQGCFRQSQWGPPKAGGSLPELSV